MRSDVVQVKTLKRCGTPVVVVLLAYFVIMESDLTVSVVDAFLTTVQIGAEWFVSVLRSAVGA